MMVKAGYTVVLSVLQASHGAPVGLASVPFSNNKDETLRGENAEREAVPVASDDERRYRMHGGPSPGAPKGNRNAFKHDGYSAEAIGGDVHYRP
jgi:hypothetical protein